MQNFTKWLFWNLLLFSYLYSVDGVLRLIYNTPNNFGTFVGNGVQQCHGSSSSNFISDKYMKTSIYNTIALMITAMFTCTLLVATRKSRGLSSWLPTVYIYIYICIYIYFSTNQTTTKWQGGAVELPLSTGEVAVIVETNVKLRQCDTLMPTHSSFSL